MGPLIPVLLAIAAWRCSSRPDADEDPIMNDSGPPDATSFSDASHVDLPNTTDGKHPDEITADLFAKDSGDVYGPDVFNGSDGAKDTQGVQPDVQSDAQPDVQPDVPTDVSVAPKYCEPKVTLLAGAAITEIAAGGDISCLIKSGTVYCAGKINSSVDPNTPLFNSTTFVAVPSLAGAKHIAVGGAHLCAIMPGNDVKCLGQNIWGQLGNGTTQDAKEAVAVSGMGDTAAIFLGGFHSLGLKFSGELDAWGYNNNGQLGLAAKPSVSNVPQIVVLPAKAVHAAAGTLHSAAVLENGDVYAWGNNKLFPLGVGGDPGKVLTPAVMQNSKSTIRVAAGADFTLVLDQKCTASAVGAGGLGQLGTGTLTNASTLTPIPSLTGISTVSAGGQHACAITMTGVLLCWGENNFGDPIKTPTSVAGVQSVVQISLGTNHGIALNASGQVFVWGKNTVGQLGLGNTTDKPSPTAVTLN